MIYVLSGWAVVAAATLCACTAMPDAPSVHPAGRNDRTRLALQPMGGSTATGVAFLSSAGDHGTEVLVNIGKLPSGITVPIRLHAGLYAGSCASKGPAPDFDLTRRSGLATSMVAPQNLGTLSAPAELSARLPVSIATLRGSSYALSVRLSPADGNAEILCGDLVV